MIEAAPRPSETGREPLKRLLDATDIGGAVAAYRELSQRGGVSLVDMAGTMADVCARLGSYTEALQFTLLEGQAQLAHMRADAEREAHMTASEYKVVAGRLEEAMDKFSYRVGQFGETVDSLKYR